MAIGSRPLTPEERRQVAINALTMLGKIVLIILLFPLFIVYELLRQA